jgi:hypothetical protein
MIRSCRKGEFNQILMNYALLATVFAQASLVFALDRQIGIHDPSTGVRCIRKYYTCGTGGSSLVSD